MKKMYWSMFAFALQLFVAENAFARAGGGGSGGGGGGGGGGGSFGGSSGSGGTPMSPAAALTMIVLGVSAVVIVLVINHIITKKNQKKRQEEIAAAAQKDSSWDNNALTQRVNEVFYAFQKAWSEYDIKTMESLLTEKYHRRMVLEMSVLANQKRKNLMVDVKLLNQEIVVVHDDSNDQEDYFSVRITAKAEDVLEDTARNKILFTDRSTFIETWNFRREKGEWKLDIITQATESVAMMEKPIKEFAERNNFFYDPDFGWLMMPNQGVLFRGTNFGKSDINNHVIGYFRNTIVEFYTYIPDINNSFAKNYLVAQAILPISYKDILIKKRQLIQFAPSGLREVHMEWGEFNKKFFVCADPADNVSTFELLSPNFMERIHDLPFALTIEVVGNVLYFATPQRTVSYEKLLEILTWAFDEMKK